MRLARRVLPVRRLPDAAAVEDKGRDREGEDRDEVEAEVQRLLLRLPPRPQRLRRQQQRRVNLRAAKIACTPTFGPARIARMTAVR